MQSFNKRRPRSLPNACLPEQLASQLPQIAPHLVQACITDLRQLSSAMHFHVGEKEGSIHHLFYVLLDLQAIPTEVL
jgi:hypothetical protein